MTIFVEGLELYGFHGVPDAEQTVGHRYVIDFKIELPSMPDGSDHIADTIDYGAASQRVIGVFQASQRRTLERLATDIAQTLLGAYKSASQVTVTVAKRLPPAPIIAERAGVTISLQRTC